MTRRKRFAWQQRCTAFQSHVVGECFPRTAYNKGFPDIERVTVVSDLNFEPEIELFSSYDDVAGGIGGFQSLNPQNATYHKLCLKRGTLTCFWVVSSKNLARSAGRWRTMANVLNFVDGEREGERSDNHVGRVEIRFPCR